jgi:hypothetical protein
MGYVSIGRRRLGAHPAPQKQFSSSGKARQANSILRIRTRGRRDVDDAYAQSNRISIMNTLRVARAALRARPAVFRIPVQRRGYAEAVNDKASATCSELQHRDEADPINRSSSACRSPTRYDVQASESSPPMPYPESPKPIEHRARSRQSIELTAYSLT